MPTESLRSRLTAASARLREVDSPALAEAVDAVLAPNGWAQLRTSDPSVSGGTERNLAMNMPESIRDQIVAAVEADPGAASVTAKVNEGYVAYLAGRFTPRKRPAQRSAQGGGKRVNLNVRPSGALRQQVTDAGASAAGIGTEYLMSQYKLGPYAQDAPAAPLPRGAERIPEVPSAVRDRIREAAKAAGERVDDVVNEGFAKYLDGRFVPEAPVWSAQERADMVAMKIRPNDGLYEQVKAAGGLRPLQVAVAYLLDEFGIEAGTAE
jgi:hypothetical protein